MVVNKGCYSNNVIQSSINKNSSVWMGGLKAILRIVYSNEKLRYTDQASKCVLFKHSENTIRVKQIKKIIVPSAREIFIQGKVTKTLVQSSTNCRIGCWCIGKKLCWTTFLMISFIY